MILNKIKGILIFSIIGCLTSCATQKDIRKYNINAHIKSGEEKKVYLRNISGEVVDSTVLQNNKLTFKGKTNSTGLHYIIIEDKSQKYSYNYPVIPLFIDDSEVILETDLDSLSKEINFKNEQYNFNQLNFKNSPLNVDFVNYNAGIRPFVDARKVLFRKYLDHLNYGKPYEEIHYGISLINSIDSIQARRVSYVKDYIVANKNSFLSLYALEDNMRLLNQSTTDSLLHIINPKVLSLKSSAYLVDRIKTVNVSALGAVFSDLQLKDDKGNDVLLSNYVGKGKYVLLEFWASWCVPCRADIPHLKKNYELYNSEGFEIISISMDTNQESWLSALKEENMPWLQLSELKGFKGDVSKQYHFTGVPTCILIDPNGNIVTRNMRGSWMDKMLIELYGDKFNQN